MKLQWAFVHVYGTKHGLRSEPQPQGFVLSSTGSICTQDSVKPVQISAYPVLFWSYSASEIRRRFEETTMQVSSKAESLIFRRLLNIEQKKHFKAVTFSLKCLVFKRWGKKSRHDMTGMDHLKYRLGRYPDMGLGKGS